MRALLIPLFLLSLNIQAEILSPISTDRPDTTESVDAVETGHYQFELNLTDYQRERGLDSFGLLGVNAKFGLDNNSDLQLVFNTWSTSEDASGEFSSADFTDWGLRFKQEILSSKSFSLSVLPYYIFAGSSDRGFAGISIPWETPLSDNYDLKGMSQFGEAIPDDQRLFQFLQTIEVTKLLTENLAGFTELIYILPDTDNSEELYFNYGLAYLLDDYTQLDFAIAHGLNSHSKDLKFITGLSFKR